MNALISSRQMPQSEIGKTASWFLETLMVRISKIMRPKQLCSGSHLGEDG